MSESVNMIAEDAPKKVIGKMVITVFEDGTLNVNGFPNRLDMALAWFFDGIRAVTSHFMEKAVNGQVNSDRSRIIKPNIILQPLNKKPV